MKTYIKPSISILILNTQQSMLAGSGGVETGAKVGNDYNDQDIDYARHGRSLWDDDED